MRRTRSRLLAAGSIVLLFAALAIQPVLSPVSRASVRPRYGGTLRIEMRARLASYSPVDVPGSLADGQAQARIAALIFDRLFELDESGQVQPRLASAAQHNASFTRWEFRLRPDVRFHDGTRLTPQDVVRSLNLSGSGAWTAGVFRDVVVVETKQPDKDLPSDLTLPRHSIVKRTPEGAMTGTGSFRVLEWRPETGGYLVLAADDDYWAGRPFLNRIEIRLGRPLRDQFIDLEVARADLIELSPDDVRRFPQSGRRAWLSQPLELMALRVHSNDVAMQDLRLRRAIALAIDRSAIHQVLLQRQGEIAGGVLPNWLTGYGFLMRPERDLETARALVSQLGAPPRPLGLAYDADDPLARTIAERIALDVRGAGITLRAMPYPNADEARDANVRLVRKGVGFIDPETIGDEKTEWLFPLTNQIVPYPLGLPGPPERMYDLEKSEVEDLYETIPLFHLPEVFGVSARVKNWAPAKWGAWRLADVWLEDAAPAKSEAQP